MSKNAYNYKRKAIVTARELCYPKHVITRLQSATTETEIERIMVQARKEWF